MNRFEKLVKGLPREGPGGMRLEPELNTVRVTFPNGRHQRVKVEREAEHYVLTSVVLGPVRTGAFDPVKLLPEIWDQNRTTDMVAFTLDKRGRLVGQIRQVAETLDVEELAAYLYWLARECDHLEYILTGKNLE